MFQKVSPTESPRTHVHKHDSPSSNHSGLKLHDAVTLSAVTNLCTCGQDKSGDEPGGGGSGGGVGMTVGTSRNQGLIDDGRGATGTIPESSSHSGGRGSKTTDIKFVTHN